jgi:hypothetical protein
MWKKMKIKQQYPCWVCGEPQDTDPNRLCIACQCILADYKPMKGLTLKQAILKIRGIKK